MAAASVLIPMSTIDQNGGVLPPSALVQHSPRHGRSRAASMKGKNGHGRRYSVVESRDAAMSKAVAFVLKRSIRESEVPESSEEDEEEIPNLVSDEEGWVSLTDLLEQPKLADLRVTLGDLQRLATPTTKARFTLRELPNKEFLVRGTQKRDTVVQAPILEGEPLKADMDDLPEFVVYETSYEAYPHIIAAGGIQKAGGAGQITFKPVTVAEDDSKSRPNRTSEADIGIWVHLKSAMEAEPSIVWNRTTSGGIFTADEIPKGLWKKAVARRTEIGLLFEDGEVRNEVPEALRGKGAKGKGKKGRRASRSMQSRDDAESESTSDEKANEE